MGDGQPQLALSVASLSPPPLPSHGLFHLHQIVHELGHVNKHRLDDGFSRVRNVDDFSHGVYDGYKHRLYDPDKLVDDHEYGDGDGIGDGNGDVL